MSVDVSNVTLFANQDPYFITVAQAQPNLGALVQLTIAIGALGFSAIQTSTTQVVITLGVIPISVNTTAGNYTIAGPSSITVTGATWTPGNAYITLTVSGTFVAGSYTVSLAANTFVDASSNFNTTAPEPLLQLSSPAVTYTAACSGKVVTITFDRAVVNSVALAAVGAYTITPPGGSPTPIVLSAIVTGATTVTLTLDDLLNAGTYSVTIAAGTAISSADGGKNLATPASFTGAGAIPPALVAAYSVSATQVRVVFSKAVRQVSSSNTDDALHLANYTAIDDVTSASLAISGVTGLVDTAVELATAAQVPGRRYTVTVTNVKDLPGNTIV